MNAEIAPKVAAGSAATPSSPRVLRFQGFTVDLDRGELRVHGVMVPLRPKTFALLACLAGSPGRLLDKDTLMASIWPEVVVTDDSLVQCVGELRTALGPGLAGLVRTVPRRGYMLDAGPPAMAEPVSSPAASPADSPPAAPSIALAGRPLVARRRLTFVLGLVLITGLLVAAGIFWLGQQRGSTLDSLAQRRAIAVLPFTGRSGDASQADFADGITAQVVEDLSRLPETLVIAQPSTDAYAGTGADLRQVGRELGVHFVVTGSVLRAADEVRIQIRLSSADTQAVLWSDTLSYANDAPWTWSQDIGRQVAHALDLRITDVVGGWKPGPPAARDAVEHTMRGFSLLRRAATATELDAAAAEFRAALRTQADSAPAWAGLSMSLSAMILNRFVPEPAALLAQAEQAAGKALALDPSHPNSHYAHGQVLLLRGQLDVALEAFEQALRLNPSYPLAHARVAVILIEQGRAAEALQHARIALRLSPRDPSLAALAHFAAGMALFHLGRDEESYAEMQKMVAASPRIGFAYQWMAAMDALHGRPDSARENLQQYRQRIPIQTIAGLKATERSRNPVFLAQRERFYDGLRLAGLPER